MIWGLQLIILYSMLQNCKKGRSLNVFIIKKKKKLMESCDMMEMLANLSG